MFSQIACVEGAVFVFFSRAGPLTFCRKAVSGKYYKEEIKEVLEGGIVLMLVLVSGHVYFMGYRV